MAASTVIADRLPKSCHPAFLHVHPHRSAGASGTPPAAARTLSRVPSPGARRRGLSIPALGGRAHPCARLGLAPWAVAALRWSPWAWRGGVVPAAGGRVWCSAGLSAGCVGVCRGFVLVGWFSCAGRVARFAGGFAGRAVVALARWLRAGCGCLPLACPAVCALVFRRCGRRRFRLCCGGAGFCCGLVGLGWLSGRCPAVRRPLWAGLGCFCAGGRAAVAAARGSRRAPGSARLCAGLAMRLPPLPLLVARVAGCRSRWLSRGSRRALAVRCPSAAVAALVCRRARAFGLPSVRAGRRGLLVLLPAARPRGPSALAVRLSGPLALAAPPALPGVPLPVPPRGGRSRSPASARPGRAVSFAQGQLF